MKSFEHKYSLDSDVESLDSQRSLPSDTPQQHVITIFAHGTEKNEKQFYLISQFAKHAVKSPSQDVLKITGPGMRGSEVSGQVKRYSDEVMRIIDRVYNGARALGKEVPEFKINMAGFSRGGITTIKLNSAIYARVREKYPKVKIRFVHPTSDAAAGYGDKADADTRQLAPDTTYFGTLHRHAVGTVTPLSPTRTLVTHGAESPHSWGRLHTTDFSRSSLTFFPLSGDHLASESVRIPPKGQKEKISNYTAIITHCLFYEILSANGTQFEGNVMPPIGVGRKVKGKLKWSGEKLEDIDPRFKKRGDETPQQTRARALLEIYGEMKLAEYESKNSPKTRRFMRELETYVPNSDFFFDAYQSTLFLQAYPHVARHLFGEHSSTGLIEAGMKGEEAIPEAVKAEYKRMKNDNPTFYHMVVHPKFLHKLRVSARPIRPLDFTGENARNSPLHVLESTVANNMLRYQHERGWWKDLRGDINAFHGNAHHLLNKMSEIMRITTDPLKGAAAVAKEIKSKKDEFKSASARSSRYYAALSASHDAAVAEEKVLSKDDGARIYKLKSQISNELFHYQVQRGSFRSLMGMANKHNQDAIKLREELDKMASSTDKPSLRAKKILDKLEGIKKDLEAKKDLHRYYDAICKSYDEAKRVLERVLDQARRDILNAPLRDGLDHSAASPAPSTVLASSSSSSKYSGSPMPPGVGFVSHPQKFPNSAPSGSSMPDHQGRSTSAPVTSSSPVVSPDTSSPGAAAAPAASAAGSAAMPACTDASTSTTDHQQPSHSTSGRPSGPQSHQ